MRAVVQRVTRSCVRMEGETVAEIAKGMNVLVGIEKEDTDRDAEYMAAKLTALRIFDDEQGKMNLSVADIGGDILIVSQFTLLGDARRGNRPSFTGAEEYDKGKAMCGRLIAELKKTSLNIQSGVYGADMRVIIENDGPVTVLLDSRKLF